MSFTGIDIKNPCVCGKNHECVTKNITTGKGEDLTAQLWDFMKSEFGSEAKGCYISDFNTGQIAHDNMRHYSTGISLDIKSHHADEYMIENCEEALKDLNYDYFIACGSGVIHDITRVVAHKYNKPFISYPTAPSVDGFVSGISPVTTKGGMKITLPTVAPVALFADIDVIAAAPKRLAASGAGDIFGKYIALADWRIANLLVGEYICEPIIQSEYHALTKVKNSLTEYSQNKNHESYETFCGDLLEALIISGLCMQYSGNSRPASGAEHHIAHFCEMGIILSTDCLHGENVGVGTVLCSELYHRFAKSDNIKFEYHDIDDNLIKKYYDNLYNIIIKENAPNTIKTVTPDIFYNNLGQIKKIISEIPSHEELAGMLTVLGGIIDLNGIQAYNLKCGKDEVKPLIFKLAPYIRDRLTLLKLMRCIEF